MTSLLRYDIARQAIAEAKSIDEVTDWIDKAAAVREYGRRIGDRQMEIDAVEIRVRAKRRRGELLMQLRAEGRLREGPDRALVPQGEPMPERITLKELGITKKESSEDQKIASISQQAYEAMLARGRVTMHADKKLHAMTMLQQDDKKARRDDRERALAAKIAALPDRRFGVIYADPEWRFEVYSRDSGMDRSADNHYPTSATDEICRRPVGDIAAPDCVLFLWATAPMLPDALRVMEAWGFTYRSQIIWIKDRIGTGYWFRNKHELLLVGARGNVPAPAMGTQWPSVVEAPVREHSTKPDIFYELIEAYFPSLPKIELNARQARAGWDAWGYEAPADHVGDANDMVPHDPETGEIIESTEPSSSNEASSSAAPQGQALHASTGSETLAGCEGASESRGANAPALGGDDVDDGMDIPNFLRRRAPEPAAP